MPAYSKLLPQSAYFAQGAGPACDQLRRDLANDGFTKVMGPSDSRQAGELWITPPGSTRVQISPPGTVPKKPYDIESEIVLVGGQGI